MGKQQPVMVVTSASMDDIGCVLSGLGFKWTHYSNLTLIENPKPDVLFVNCGSPTSSPDLREFVEKGGVVYISDHACTDVELLLESEPTSANFSLSGEAGTYVASVIDQNLITYLGTEHIDLEFDMGQWAVITTPPNKSNILLEVNNNPVLFTYNLGKGSLIFTSFHNSAQKSELEKKLIQYLALKPLLRAKTIKTVKQTTRRGGAVEILKEIEPVLSKKSNFVETVSLKPTFGILTAELSWLGNATVTMQILQGDKVLKRETAKMSPFRTSIDSSHMHDLRLSVAEYPFSVVISLDDYPEQMLLTSLVLSVESLEKGDISELKTLLGM
jgi:hypothetical protein